MLVMGVILECLVSGEIPRGEEVAGESSDPKFKRGIRVEVEELLHP